MAATFEWSESNGVGEDITDGISNINFGSADIVNLVPSAHPIVGGGASFEKYIRCKFTGVWTEISNMKFWKSLGSYVAGESIKLGIVDYAQPSSTPNADSNVDETEPGWVVNSGEGNPTIEYGATGVSGYTQYMRLQLQTTGSTPAGAVHQKTFTFQYDEV
jgi:hypothetical protein